MEWFLGAIVTIVLSFLWGPSLNALLYRLGVPVASASFGLTRTPEASLIGHDLAVERVVFRFVSESRCLFYRKAPSTREVGLRSPLLFVEPFLVGEMTFAASEAKGVARLPLVYHLPPVFAGMFMAAVDDSFPGASSWSYVQCPAFATLMAGAIAAGYIAVVARPAFMDNCREILGFLRDYRPSDHPPR